MRIYGEYAFGPAMPSVAALRIEIERALERRFPAALTPVPRTKSETATTGVPEVDALLDGGLAVGAISEVTGPQSSGRTGLALSFLAQQTQNERVCAWVDAGDAFDPVLSLEDEAGIANIVLAPDVFEQNRIVVTRNRFLLIEGPLQNQDRVVHVKAQRITTLDITSVDIRSHDFH
jgi:RecA/RadA recombinase